MHGDYFVFLAFREQLEKVAIVEPLEMILKSGSFGLDFEE